MATITTGAHPKALWEGVAAWWGMNYPEYSPEYTQIFDVKGSSKNYEEDVQSSGFGLVPIKSEGGGVQYDSHTQGYVSRYVHVAYGMGYVVTKEELDDNLYTEVSMSRAESLMFSERQTKENVGANVLNRAFNSSFTGGDSKELLATDHSDFHGTWQNEPTTATDLSESALEDLTILIMQALNPRGLKISLVPQRLIIPVNLTYEATRILDSQLQNDSANNAVNALRAKGIIPEVAVNHYLTDTDAWFIKTNAPRGMCWYDRNPTEFTTDQEFDTENAKAKVYCRFSAGWTDPRGMYGSPGA